MDTSCLYDNELAKLNLIICLIYSKVLYDSFFLLILQFYTAVDALRGEELTHFMTWEIGIAVSVFRWQIHLCYNCSAWIL